MAADFNSFDAIVIGGGSAGADSVDASAMPDRPRANPRLTALTLTGLT